MEFNIGNIGPVSNATLALDYTSKSIRNETCTFSLYSIPTVGSSIDNADWSSAPFETITANFYDNTITGDVNADITNAWNNAVASGRNYLTFRIALNNEQNYISTLNNCSVYFADSNSGGANPHIDYQE